jgi:hypothetical protein
MIVRTQVKWTALGTAALALLMASPDAVQARARHAAYANVHPVYSHAYINPRVYTFDYRATAPHGNPAASRNPADIQDQTIIDP